MMLKNQRLFIHQFRTNFFHVGALLPSSRALGRAGAAFIPQHNHPIRVLEAGAGTGSFTREIIARLGPGDWLDAVEINPDLVSFLDQRIQHDPAFANHRDHIRLINADLLHFPFNMRYDYIVFSLPLTNFPAQMVQDILTIMMEHLKPGGVFSYVKYAFIGQVKYWFGAMQTRTEMDATQAIIRSFARQYQFDRRLVWPNVPPTWVHYWRKPEC